jgi:hypothetical protein
VSSGNFILVILYLKSICVSKTIRPGPANLRVNKGAGIVTGERRCEWKPQMDESRCVAGDFTCSSSRAAKDSKPHGCSRQSRRTTPPQPTPRALIEHRGFPKEQGTVRIDRGFIFVKVQTRSGNLISPSELFDVELDRLGR